MNRSNFTEEQIIEVLRVEGGQGIVRGTIPLTGEAGAKTAELCRKRGM